MNLMFTPSALALFLSAANVVAISNIEHSDNAVELLTNHVNSSYQQKKSGGGVETYAQRRRVGQLELGPNEEEGADVDVGLLHHGGMKKKRRGNKIGIGLFGGHKRILQSTGEIADEPETCPKPDTCEPTLCNCVADGGKAYDCAAELHAVCNGVTDANGKTWDISGCVGYAEYYENLYCPYAACLVGGGTRGTCGCTFYEDSCEIYRDDPEYGIEAGYEETILHCAISTCCKTKDEDDHLGREECFEDASSQPPSMMPSGPTVSPTTASPTITPKPTEERATPSPQAQTETSDDTGTPPSPTPGVPSGPDTEATDSSATQEAPSSAQRKTSGITGAATVVALLIWSLFD